MHRAVFDHLHDYLVLAAPAREHQLRLDAAPGLPSRPPILAQKGLVDEPLELGVLLRLEQIRDLSPLGCVITLSVPQSQCHSAAWPQTEYA